MANSTICASVSRARAAIVAGLVSAAVPIGPALTAAQSSPETSTPETEAGAAASVQQTAQPLPTDCADAAAPYRDFDFWLGEWSVALPDGTPAGVNRITTKDGGCTLLEEWRSASGGVGLSLNFVDPATRQWRQVWSSPGVTIDYSGGLDGAAMAMEGAISYAISGDAFPFRGRWTPREDGAVLQEFWQYNPDTDAWDVWFTGVYTRRADPAPGGSPGDDG